MVERLGAPASCITRAGVVARGYNRDTETYIGMLQGDIVSLRRAGERPPIGLVLSHEFLVEQVADRAGGWVDRTVSWSHELVDHVGRSILAYHWHPVGQSKVTWPHVHVYGRTEPEELRKAHLPTGDVSLAAVVRMLSDDFGVIPVRADWRAILARHEDLPR